MNSHLIWYCRHPTARPYFDKLLIKVIRKFFENVSYNLFCGWTVIVTESELKIVLLYCISSELMMSKKFSNAELCMKVFLSFFFSPSLFFLSFCSFVFHSVVLFLLFSFLLFYYLFFFPSLLSHYFHSSFLFVFISFFI
jgi:hypothetical protein